MNEEKYIREVLKQLNCSKKDKLKIKEDLKSDLQLALESGKTWQEIQESLGSPLDYANELNEEFAYSPKKSRKKLIITIICIVIIVILAIVWAFNYFIPKTYPLSDSTIFKKDELQVQVDEVIDDLNNENYSALKIISSDELKAHINKKELNKAKATLGNLGTYQKITNQEFYEVKAQGQTYALIEVVALYDVRSVTYTISFNEEMELAGIYMK